MLFVIIRTGGGIKYGTRIGEELQARGHRFVVPVFHEFSRYLRDHQCTKFNTAIHTRAAYPMKTGWMGRLFELEREGWAVINSPQTTWLTSNKLKCAEKLIEAGIPHPKTTLARNVEDVWNFMEEFIGGCSVILKNKTSNGGGDSIVQIHAGDTHNCVEQALRGLELPAICQERISYTAIYRVVVFDGCPLTTVWKDVPTAGRWQVSVCLNPRMTVVRNAPRELFEMAARAQEVVDGEINFIDIYETADGFVMSEINTACNLLRHERLSGINIAGKIAGTLITLIGE